MDESTCRRVCRVAFLLIVVLPCLGLFGFAGWRATAWHDDAVRDSIRDALGVDATWERITFPAPGEMRLEGLELLDPRTGEALASLESVSIVELSGQRKIGAGAVQVPQSAIPRLACALESLDCEAIGDWQLENCELQITGRDEKPLAVATVSRAESWNAEGIRRMLVRFRPGRDQNQEELKLDLELDRAADQWRMVFDTGKTNAPMKVAAVIWPRLRAFGAEATFAGALQLAHDASGWDGALQGEFDAIDLEQLVARRTKQHLTGTGALRVDLARIENGKLVEAKGRFGADEGTIGHGLLADLSGTFRIPSAPQLDLKDRNKRELESAVSEIRMSFELTNDRVTLTGEAMPGTVLLRDADGEPMLFGAQQNKDVSPRGALQVFFPTADAKIAAAEESLWLASWLSVPTVAELPTYQPKTQPDRNALRTGTDR
jgi:hypothetical protein